jgi:alpha-tubulin suppressor-like RCC1 family protein
VGALTNWSKLAAPLLGTGATLAIKTDGTLWSWGGNPYGQLGSSATVYRSSPAQVGALTDWSKISIGSSAGAAIKTDGTLWLWGRNNYGTLGINSNVDRISSPTQVGSGTTWSEISLASGTILAKKTDGTLWGWGYNNNGQLGFSDLVNRSSPTQIGTDTNWNLISSGGYGNTMATKTNGTLWAWGQNQYGQVGTNDKVNRSSPVQISSATNWIKIFAASTLGMAVANT